VPKRFFSYQQRPTGYNLPAMFGVGLGTAGLMYLMRYSYQMKESKIPAQQMNFFNPVVQQRISRSMSYFGGGLAITGLLVGALRNSSIAYMNPWGLLFLSLGTLIGTSMTNYQQQPLLKHGLWFSFMTATALGLIPLINMASLPIIYDALFATGFTMGGLGLVAYNAPSE
jgi:FtsH-binding integral membrane protein